MDRYRCGSIGVWKFYQTFHLKMWFFEFITGVNFRWDYVLWHIVALMSWIGICTKLKIYRVPPDLAK